MARRSAPSSLTRPPPSPARFTYSPPLGTILHAGLHQSLSVTFKATDATDYTTATATVLINVDQATLTVSWPTPGEITYGTAPSAHQLDATASVPGTFTLQSTAGNSFSTAGRTNRSA